MVDWSGVLKPCHRKKMDYKTIFIVDPVKSERLQLARFIKQETSQLMAPEILSTMIWS